MKKNNTNIILITSIVLFIVMVVFFVYFLQIIKNKNKHISAVITTYVNKIKEKDNIKILEKKMAELGDTHKKIGGYLVDTSSIDTFVEYLENMGDSNNIDLIVKSVEVPKNEKNKLILTIDINGSFSNVMKIIALIENAPYNIVINSSFLNKEILANESDVLENKEDTELPIKKKSSWQATISFSVLTL